MNSILDDFKLAFRSGNILYQIIVINVVVFVAVNILLFGIMTMAGQEGLYGEVYRYLSLSSRPEEMLFKPLSMVTYMFTHGGFFHLLFNMLFMFWFGRIITEYLGQNKILGLYVWGGLAGGVLYILIYNFMPYYNQEAFLVGASAGVIAIVVGAATFQPDFVVRLFLFGPVKIKWIALVMVASSTLRTLGDNAGGEIAHVGGAILGYFFIKQLQAGNDWSKPLAKFLIWVKSFFVSQPKIKVSYKNEQRFGSSSGTKSKRTSTRSSRGSKSKEPSQEEIDAILDKISEKGYDALSKEEKQKLFNAGNQ